jgi:hypothetical protein
MKKLIIISCLVLVALVPVTAYAANNSKPRRITTVDDYYVDRIEADFNSAGRPQAACYVVQDAISKVDRFHENSTSISCVRIN